MKNLVKLAFASIVAINLFGCAATHTAITKRNLDVQTKMSETIFLDPVGVKDKTIFVQVRNSTDKPDLELANAVKAAIVAKGYRLMADPDQAHFILQANLLSVDKTDKNPISSPFGGYGAAVLGGGAGALISAVTGGSSRQIGVTALAVGALAGITETLASALVTDVYYIATADIQIKERTKIGIVSQSISNQKLKNGTGGGTSVTTNESVEFKIYQTRVISVANQVNLDFVDAAPMLSSGLSKVISGLFE